MNNTLQNGFRILEYLAGEAEDCSVKELAEHFGLPDCNVSRLMKTLAATGYVERAPGSCKYRISVKILNLSNARLRKLRLRAIAQPTMKQLKQELKRPVYLVTNFRGLAIIISSELAELSATGNDLTIGTMHKPNGFASGKLCAAHASAEELPQVLERCDWSAYTEKSITTPEAFARELEKVRRDGYAMTSGELEPDLGGLAVPVYDPRHELAGTLEVMFPRDESLWTAKYLHDCREKLRAASGAISLALGGGEYSETRPSSRVSAGRPKTAPRPASLRSRAE